MGENNENGVENPWESASNDEVFREQAASQTQKGRRTGTPQTTGEPSTPAVTSVRWQIDEDNHNNNTTNDVSFLTSDTATGSNDRRREARATCPNCLTKCSLSYFLHVWDVVLTTFWMAFVGYHLYYNKENESSRSKHMTLLLILCIVLTVLNALRGFVWIWASLPSLSMICCCGCCFVDDDRNNGGGSMVSKLATTLTLWLGIVYGIISITAWFGPSSWLPWCDGLGLWCSELIPTKTALPIALTIASVIEMIRFTFLRGQLSSSRPISMERTRSPDYYNDDVSSSPSESSRHRPWWISRHAGDRNNSDGDGLNNPLLDSGTTTNRQPGWTTTTWLPFSTRGSNSRNNNGTNSIINGDEEDVASVLDSLGEDWASRAESDPYWWTR